MSHPYLKIIRHVVLASEAREDANDFLVAFYHQKATETECALSLSLALTEIRKAIADLREQESLLEESAQSLQSKEAA